MARWKRGQSSWTDEEINKLRSLRNNGADMTTISKEIGKSYGACNNFIQRYADRYGIKTKRRNQASKAAYSEYNGPVPYLHWTITKPWRISDDNEV